MAFHDRCRFHVCNCKCDKCRRGKHNICDGGHNLDCHKYCS